MTHPATQLEREYNQVVQRAAREIFAEEVLIPQRKETRHFTQTQMADEIKDEANRIEVKLEIKIDQYHVSRVENGRSIRQGDVAKLYAKCYWLTMKEKNQWFSYLFGSQVREERIQIMDEAIKQGEVFLNKLPRLKKVGRQLALKKIENELLLLKNAVAKIGGTIPTELWSRYRSVKAELKEAQAAIYTPLPKSERSPSSLPLKNRPLSRTSIR